MDRRRNLENENPIDRHTYHVTKDNIPQKKVNRRVSHALLVNLVPTRLLQTVAVKIVQPGGIDQKRIMI